MVKGKRIGEIKGFEGYSICESGLVYSLLQQLQHPENTGELSQRVDRGGYLTCRLSAGGTMHTKFVHRLLAEAFVSNPLNLPEVDHADGNRLNLALTNIRWCTHAQNTQYAYDLCLIKKKTKRVVDITTGEIFQSIREASNQRCISYATLKNYLSGRRANVTTLKYFEED